MKKDCFSDKNKINKYFDLAKFMRIVGDDNRLRILCLLKDGEKCVCEIYSNLNMSQNLTSSHLKVLLDFELISIRQEWKRNYYSINKKVFKKYNLLLKNFLKNYEK